MMEPAPLGRRWHELFPGHPVAWLFVAALLVAVMIAKPRQAPQPAESSEVASPAPVVVEPALSDAERARQYGWLPRAAAKSFVPLADRLAPPPGFVRVRVERNSFADWLRHLPVKPAGTPVVSGGRKVVMPGTAAQLAAVVDLQPGNSNLLNAANIVLRLRAEYLWGSGAWRSANFRFTNGQFFPFARWDSGQRPIVSGRSVDWARATKADDPRVSYAGYMETLFRYSSVYSLIADTVPVRDDSIQPGDLFAVPGRPGHVVLVLDAATNSAGGVCVLLGQGGTPAQTFHVVRSQPGVDWYELRAGSALAVPGYGTMSMKHLRRWPAEAGAASDSTAGGEP
ncbi:MAG: DUF4846 domain-containing protein [Phycisphaerae bacterium]